jgi:chromosome segregation ATPase
VINIRDNISGDERRRRDEAQLVALQEQVEQLRLLLKESNSRHLAAEEAQRKLEETVSAHEVRFSAAVGPVPHLQAQLSELATQTRARLQELGQDQHRVGEIQAQIDRLPPQVERSSAVARAVREELVALRAEVDEMRKDWRKVGDSVGLVEQDARRRLSEMATRAKETNERIDALKEELPPLDAAISRVRQELQQALPKFDQFARDGVELQERIDRVAALDFDRHTQAMNKADDVRAALEERLKVVERLNDTRFGSSMSRFADLEEADRATGHRITLLAVRLDELRDQDEAIRLEMRRLEELRIRFRLEQAQQEAVAFSDRLAQIQSELSDDEDEDL